MDQAAALRSLSARARRPVVEGREERGAFVVGSGKGGVGKSVLAALVAGALARRGRRTLLLDGSQNQGNLHILLGVRPAAPLTALLEGEIDPGRLTVPAGPGLWLLPAESGSPALHALNGMDRARLHVRLSALYDRFDEIVADGGPGIDGVVRLASIRARRLVVVTVPEPAALSDAYALLKIVHLECPALPIGVVVNRTADAEEGPACFARLELAARRFLGRALDFLGAVPEDEALRAAARRPGALLAAAPPAIEAMAARLAGSEAEAGAERACR